MPGQLWQECSRAGCDTEPVCVDCERCDQHCRCSQDARDRQQRAAFEAAYPGFLQRVAVHDAQGGQEQ